MSTSTVFKNYAYYYDLLYQDKNYKGEVEYVDRLIKRYLPESNAILDLGCGTASHATFFADKGYIIYGIDLSEQMIRLGKEKLGNRYKGKITLAKGDVRNVKLKQKFDVVTLLFNVIGYQTQNDDLNATLHTANKHLKKGGIFIFDFWYGPAVFLDFPKSKIKKIKKNDLLITRRTTPKININSNYVEINFGMHIKKKGEKESKHFNETHNIRYLFIPEVQNMLKNNGFESLVFEQWMTSKKPNVKTWYVCAVAKKI